MRKPKMKSLGSLSGKRIWIDKINTAIFFLGDVDIQVDEDAKLILEIKIDSDSDARVNFQLEAEYDDDGKQDGDSIRKRITFNSSDIGEDSDKVLDLLTVNLKNVGLQPIMDDGDADEHNAEILPADSEGEKNQVSQGIGTTWLVGSPRSSSPRDWLATPGVVAESVQEAEDAEAGISGDSKEQESARPAWIFPYGDGVSYTVRREL